MEQSPSHGQSLFHPRGVLSERFVNLLRKFKPIHYESNAICENFSVHLVEAAEKLEEEVLELIESNRQRKDVDHITAREVLRARIVTSAATARALLERMEQDGLLVGENITPPHGGKTTRIYRAAKNPVHG